MPAKRDDRAGLAFFNRRFSTKSLAVGGLIAIGVGIVLCTISVLGLFGGPRMVNQGRAELEQAETFLALAQMGRIKDPAFEKAKRSAEAKIRTGFVILAGSIVGGLTGGVLLIGGVGAGLISLNRPRE